MAKLRVNHRRNRGVTSGTVLRLGLFTFFLLALLLLPKVIRSTWAQLALPSIPIGERYFLPLVDSMQIRHEPYFSYAWPTGPGIGWVAYRLSPEMLKRSDGQRYEAAVFAFLPVAEFGFDELAMKSLELPFKPLGLSATLGPAEQQCGQLIRTAVRQTGPVYVTRGCLLDSLQPCKALFIAGLALDAQPQKAIAQYLDLRADTAAWLSIDSLEARIGLDLYHNFMPAVLEDSLEAARTLALWPKPEDLKAD
ncbi:MAG: hypothetical protein KDC44_01445 [Phaeodactylibacter sp.]|nr:hypothetical protein [Phaeodactylibacter sp.]